MAFRRLGLLLTLAWAAACLPDPDYPEFTHGNPDAADVADVPVDVAAELPDADAVVQEDVAQDDGGPADDGVVADADVADVPDVGDEGPVDPGPEDPGDVPVGTDACAACPDASADVCGPCGFDIVVDVKPPECTSYEDCDDENPCTDDTCDPVEGCEHTPRNASCSDGNACTVGDKCEGTFCKPGTALICDDGNACTEDSCDPSVGCVAPAKPGVCAVSRCEGKRFFGEVSCDGTTCPFQGYVECGDTNACTDDECDPVLGCQRRNNTSQCSAPRCQLKTFYPAATCADGACPVVLPMNCDDKNMCTDDTCALPLGCANKNNTLACAAARCEGLTYFPSAACRDGACPAVDGIPCDDGNPCTSDSCDAIRGGCQHVANTDECDDFSECTINDRCASTKCVGEPRVCNDGSICTEDSCDPANGCVFLDVPAVCASGSCGEGGFTPPAVCDQGECPTPAAVSCDDGNDCTDDSCDPVAGCVHQPNTLPCDDGNACTTGDQCDQSACRGGPEPDCDDQEACTDDSCDPLVGGCVHDNNTAQCLPGLCAAGWWLQPAYCSNGACPTATSVECGDGNPCTDDRCDAATGCSNVPNQEPCRAASCAGLDFHPVTLCSEGACPAADTLPCDDGFECTNDACDLVLGCVNVVRGGACDDGDFCTLDDLCSAGKCEPGTQRTCNDGLSCTADSCDPVAGHCDNEPVEGFCVINASCVASGVTQPLNVCQKCVPAQDPLGWTGVTGGSCAIYPYGTATCLAGTCDYACGSGRGDCDPDRMNGCETDTNSDPLHCGDCVTTCDIGTHECVGGLCRPIAGAAAPGGQR